MFIVWAKLALGQCLVPVALDSHTSTTQVFLVFNIYLAAKDSLTGVATEWREKGKTPWNTVNGSYVTISNLKPNTEHEWRGKVNCRASPTAAYTDIKTFITTCSPPSNIGYNGDVIPTGVQIGWYSLPTVDGYVVRWRKQNTTVWQESALIKPPGNYMNYTINALENGSSYTYQVKTICGSNSTEYSNIISSFKAECSRVFIGTFSFNSTQTNSTRMNWGVATAFNGLRTFELYWRKVGTTNWSVVQNLTNSFYDIKDLSPNTEYEVRMRKICEAGLVSDFSNITTFKTLACPIVPKPTLSSNKTANSFCQGQSVTLSASGCAGTVKWGGGQISSAIAVIPADNTTYSAVCQSNGCESQSQNIDLKIYKPSVSIAGKNEFCAGGSTTLTASSQNTIGTVNYQWKVSNANVGNNQNNFTATQAGTYRVDITDGQSCTAQSSTFAVTEKGTDIVANTNPAGNVLAYSPDKILLSATIGKEYGYQWQRDKNNVAGATGSIYEAVQSGSYAVVVSKGECSRVSETVNIKIDIPLSTPPIQSDLFRVFPNPTNGFLQLETSKKRPTHIAIIDCLGNIVLDNNTARNQTVFQIDLSNKPNGLYFLQVFFTDSIQIIKILKTN